MHDDFTAEEVARGHVLLLAQEFGRGAISTQPRLSLPGFDEALRECVDVLPKLTGNSHNRFLHALREAGEAAVYDAAHARVFLLPVDRVPVGTTVLPAEAIEVAIASMVASGALHPDAVVVVSGTLLSRAQVAGAGPGAIASLLERGTDALVGDGSFDQAVAEALGPSPTDVGPDGAVVGVRILLTPLTDGLSEREDVHVEGLGFVSASDGAAPTFGSPTYFDRFCRETCIADVAREVARVRTEHGLPDRQGRLHVAVDDLFAYVHLAQDRRFFGPWKVSRDLTQREMAFFDVARRLTGQKECFYRDYATLLRDASPEGRVTPAKACADTRGSAKALPLAKRDRIKRA